MASKTLGKSQIEALWIQAGGNKAVAKVAAAIALAESGGNPSAVNPEGPEHAEGLWQIKGQDVPGNPLDPQVSAANAVAKYRAAGGFTPWTTFTSGAYKSHLSGGESALEEGENLLLDPGYGIKALKGENPSEGTPLGEKGILAGITSTSGLIKAITEPGTWLRLAEGVGGIVLFMVGLKTLTRGSGGGALQEASRQSHDVRDIAVAATLK